MTDTIVTSQRTITCGLSLSTNGDALDMLLAARRAWERTSDQLTIDLETLTERGVYTSDRSDESDTTAVQVGGVRHSPRSVSVFSSSAPRETGGIQTPEPHLSGALRGADSVRPVTNGRRNGVTASPASPPLPRGEAVEDGLAASPFNEGGRRNSSSRGSAAPAKKGR